MKTGKRLAAVTILVTLLLGAVILFITWISSINFIEDGTVGVVRRFGEITEVITPGGWNVRWSWWHSIEIYDVRIQEVDLVINTYTRDAQNIQGRVSIQYHIIAGAASEIAREFGPLDQLESMLHAMLITATQDTFALKTAMELVEHRAELPGEIFGRVRPLQSNFHVMVTNVAIEELQFTDAFRQAVDQRVVADQRLMQAEIDAETARVQAQLALDVARLEAEAVLVAARADAESLVIMQEAWGELGTEVRSVMIQQLAIEVWDGVLPRVVVSGDSGFSLILDAFGDDPVPAASQPVVTQDVQP